MQYCRITTSMTNRIIDLMLVNRKDRKFMKNAVCLRGKIMQSNLF